MGWKHVINTRIRYIRCLM